jgi:hypothetical protein
MPVRYDGVWLAVTVPEEDREHRAAICRPYSGAIPVYDEWAALAGYTTRQNGLAERLRRTQV